MLNIVLVLGTCIITTPEKLLTFKILIQDTTDLRNVLSYKEKKYIRIITVGVLKLLEGVSAVR